MTGGARSGKSGFATSLAEKTGKRLVYLATGTPGDAEMAARIERHRKARNDSWQVIEEPVNITDAVKGLDGADGITLVLDCLTLWISNLMMAGVELSDESAGEKTSALAGALRGLGGASVVVSNEVGMGIVPENALARRFRDAAGTVNRIMADAADEVYLVVSGIPVKIK